MELRGTFTALITPFTRNDEVDYEGLEKNIEMQLKSGINGLVVLGTTAETPTLTTEERDNIVKIAIEKAKGKVPVIIGTGTNSTKIAIKNTIKAEKDGADAALVVAPYYNKPTQSGLYDHFKKIADSVNIPIILYNVQSRTGVNIEPETVLKLATHPNIIGIKDASGDLKKSATVITTVKKENIDFSVVSGDDITALSLMAIGAKGIVSVVSNIAPKTIRTLTNLALENRFDEAQILYSDIFPLLTASFVETNPIPIKEAMNMVGLPAGKVRLPLSKLKEENRKALLKIVDSLKKHLK